MNKLNIRQELKNLNSILDSRNIGRRRTIKPYISEIVSNYSYDLIKYRELLKTWDKTKVNNAHWELKGEQLILSHDTGHAVLFLTENEKPI